MEREPEPGKGKTAKSGRKGKILIILGISLVLLGLLAIAGIYAYIWYTNHQAAGAQEKLLREWEERPAEQQGWEVAVGEGIARIIVPRLELDAIVVELWGLGDAENLKRGPGHLPETAYPGQPGNCVISGHRTTYGAPFRHLEQVQRGDEIILMTAHHRHTYLAEEQHIVEPTDLTVIEQGEEAKVTLTACHPWYSAAQRIVVIGSLVESEEI